MLNIWGRATLQEGHLITTKPKTITMIILEKWDALGDRHDPAVAAITGIHAIRSYTHCYFTRLNLRKMGPF